MSLTDHVSAGDAAARSKQWELASSAYEKALEMQPQNGRIRARYGNALFKRGDMGGAEVELRQALSLGAAVAHKYLGHMAREQGDISGANTHYQAYLGSSPPDARAIKLLIETMTP
jgi:Tfp pilus assembly protein PilF